MKKKLLYSLLFCLLLFFNMVNVNAVKEHVVFEINGDFRNASTKLRTFIDNFCNATSGCHRYCIEEGYYSADSGTGSSCGIADGFTKFYGNYNTFGDTLENAKKEFIIFLNDQSTLKTTAATLCKNGELKGSACDAITENVGNSDTANKNVKSCPYTLQKYGTDSTNKVNWATSYVDFDIRNGGLSLRLRTDGTNNLQDFDTGVISNGEDRYYFHSITGGKYSSWDSFKSEYIKRFKESNYSCSASNLNIKFCAVKRDNYYYDWYAELDGNCDETLYPDLIGTQTSTDGVNEEGVDYEVEDVEINFDIIANDDVLSCEALIGTELQKLLKLVVNIVKIAIPIILLVLGTLDFAQAIFAQSEDAIKKASGKFVKRLIIAVVIFLVPTALKLILTLANSVWDVIPSDLCGIL